MSVEISRRNFLETTGKVLLAAKLAPLLAACGEPDIEVERPEMGAKEREPRFGDVIVADGKAFLLKSNGKRYPLLEGELDSYKRASKLIEHKRDVFNVPRDFAEAYPLGKRLTEPLIINKFTGLPMVNVMGEIPTYWAGLFTSEDFSFDALPQIKPVKTFPKITAALEKQGWKDPYSSLFRYGKKALTDFNVDEAMKGGGLGYDMFDTLRPLPELFRDGLEYFETIQEDFPYCQINPIGHSLGGVIATRAVMEYPSSVNGLTLISSPVRGVEGKLVDLFHSTLSKVKKLVDIDEAVAKSALRVIEDLAALRNDQTYQKELDDFSTSFVANGGKLLVAIDESDPWVSEASAMLKGATKVRIKSRDFLPSWPSLIGSLMGLPKEVIDFVNAHGRPLGNQQVIKEITNALGDNRSVPIGKWQ